MHRRYHWWDSKAMGPKGVSVLQNTICDLKKNAFLYTMRMKKELPQQKIKKESKNLSEIATDEYVNSATTEPVLHVGLAALAAQFPVASPFIGLLSNLIPSRRMIRVERQLNDCFRRLGEMQVVIDKEWINREEFGFLFEECIRGFAENYQQEKIDAFKAILIKATIGSGMKVSEQEFYLSLVHRLTALHIKLLRLLDDARKIPQGGPAIQSLPSVQATLGVDLSIIVAAYADLETLQFTNTQSSSIGSYLTVPLERMQGRINQAAIKFIEFITLQ